MSSGADPGRKGHGEKPSIEMKNTYQTLQKKPFAVLQFKFILTGLDEAAQGPLCKGALNGKASHKTKTADFKLTEYRVGMHTYVWGLRKYVNFIQCCKEIQAGAPAPRLPLCCVQSHVATKEIPLGKHEPPASSWHLRAKSQRLAHSQRATGLRCLSHLR